MSLSTENEMLRSQIRELQTRLAPRPAGMRDELSQIQSRYDQVDQAFGLGAPEAVGPLPYETPLQYRKRRLAAITKYSPACRNIRTEALGEDSIGPIEERAIADATTAARDPANYKPGEMRAVRSTDPSGRTITKWVGDSMAWRQHFMTGAQVGRIKSPKEIASDPRA